MPQRSSPTSTNSMIGWLLVGLAVAALAGLSCRGGDDDSGARTAQAQPDDQAAQVAHVAQTTQVAQAPQSPDGRSTAVESGRLLFAANCAQCHGAELQGSNTGPPLLHEYYVPSHHGNASFVIAIMRGVRQHHWQFGDMPAVAALSVEQAHEVICFIRQRQLEDGLIDAIPMSTPC